MLKLKLLSLIGITPLTMPLITVCGCANYTPDENFTPVHEFINDRIFSVLDVSTEYSIFGTMWLFYHDKTANNNYTYYGLTNNHVTSGFNELQIESSPKKFELYLGYQDKEGASSSNQLIPFSTVDSTKNGRPNRYSLLEYNESATLSGYTKFKPLFTTYIKNSNGEKYYRDMTIVKVDLSDYKDTELGKKRLDKLNTYGDAHNNMLVQFDDYSNLTTSSIYCGGYPVDYMDSDAGTIYNRALKFQSMKFENCTPEYRYDMDEIMYVGSSWASVSGDVVFNANNSYVYGGSLYSPDWEGPQVTNRKTPFGGGASGSMAIRCTDENDPETYKVTGIYWGGEVSTSAYWYFRPHFTPFMLNFGQNIPEVTQTNIIDSFFSQASYPVDYQMYSV